MKSWISRGWKQQKQGSDALWETDQLVFPVWVLGLGTRALVSGLAGVKVGSVSWNMTGGFYFNRSL